jgi:hypothetical protein
VFPAIEFRDSVQNRLVLFNLSTIDTKTATIRITFPESGEAVERSYVLAALERRVVDLDALRPAGATGAVVRLGAGSVRGFVESVDSERGDSVAASPGSSAFTRWAFADGFLDRNTAGAVGFETLSLYNPDATAAVIEVRLLFTDGTFADREVTVQGRSMLQLRLDQEDVILEHAQLNFYSIMVTSPTPIVASMTHWDLFQGGGWATLGTPSGVGGNV